MLEEGITVLDSGCGPATWTFEIGESYPRSKIYGVDASCVFPEDIKPANVDFAIGNIAKRIPYEDSMFDYVHQRLLFLGLTDEDWTNPGGYIEMAEPDLSNMGKAGPALATLINTFQKGMESRGMRINSGAELEGRLREAGFENIVVKNLSIPVNHGGKIDYRHAFMNVKPVLSKTNPEFENQEVYEAHLNKCGEEARRSQAHLGWYAVYAQKPVFSEQ
ncbi:hypothetical protein CU098_008472 [Rhizopus stolonifer]|uniref:Methyltransferase domain-containing protein n=1 Tax=Rhizopus stolonifer TaxID=4846 RepID=A0A367J3H9_RHIST|nr:hypothetical protein CU098_008472 [Rhizopus stolonifer]